MRLQKKKGVNENATNRTSFLPALSARSLPKSCPAMAQKILQPKWIFQSQMPLYRCHWIPIQMIISSCRLPFLQVWATAMCGTKPHGEVSRDAHGKPDEDDKTPQPFWGIPRHSSVEELLNLLVHDLSKITQKKELAGKMRDCWWRKSCTSWGW